MFVYSREQCRHFRADGVAWQTRSNGKTLSEAHEVCKVRLFMLYPALAEIKQIF